MKNSLFLLTSIILLTAVFSPNYQIKAASLSNEIKAVSEKADSGVVIYPIPEQDSGAHGPRLPMLVPISASYEAMLSTLFLTFTSNLGEIEVEVMNTTTGGYDSGTVDTQFLYAAVPITMGPGHYLILFTLPSGQRYKGELDI